MANKTPIVVDPASGMQCVASSWDNATPENNNAPPPNGAPNGMFPNQVEPTFREIMTAVAQVLGVSSAAYGNAQNALSGVASLIASTNSVPKGAIMPFSSTYGGSCPIGWAVCNGTEGTPDLRDRFMVCAGTTYTDQTGGGQAVTSSVTDIQGGHSHTGATGQAGSGTFSGSTDAQGAHSHTGTTGQTAITVDQMPSHNHTIMVASSNSGSDSGIAATPSTGTTANGTSSTGGGSGHGHSISTDGTHQHGVSITVSSHAHSINIDGSHQHNVPSITTLPPYIALVYIMKL